MFPLDPFGGRKHETKHSTRSIDVRETPLVRLTPLTF